MVHKWVINDVTGTVLLTRKSMWDGMAAKNLPKGVLKASLVGENVEGGPTRHQLDVWVQGRS